MKKIIKIYTHTSIQQTTGKNTIKVFFRQKNQMKNVTELKFVGYNNKPKKNLFKKCTLKATLTTTKINKKKINFKVQFNTKRKKT